MRIGYIVENKDGVFGEALIYKRKLSRKKEYELMTFLVEKYWSPGVIVRTMSKMEIIVFIKEAKALTKFAQREREAETVLHSDNKPKSKHCD